MTACSLLDERADDFAWCEDVIRRNSHSFHRAFSLLPACKRQSVYALYAFCRLADDCVDRDASAAKLEQVQDDLIFYPRPPGNYRPDARCRQTYYHPHF